MRKMLLKEFKKFYSSKKSKNQTENIAKLEINSLVIHVYTCAELQYGFHKFDLRCCKSREISSYVTVALL